MTRPARPLRSALALALLAAGCGGGGGESASSVSIITTPPGPVADGRGNSRMEIPPERGNILLLLADDLGIDGIERYGVSSFAPSTPVINQLAEDGVLFRSAWGHPICSPTRAAIHTGKTASDSGIGWNTSVHPVFSVPGITLDEFTLPELLEAGTTNAYRTAHIGKWHLGHTPDVGDLDAPNEHGWEYFAGSMGNLKNYFSYKKVTNGNETQSTKYALTEKIDDAIAWIQSVKGPWFCYLAFNTPHGPAHKPPSELHSKDLSPTGDVLQDERNRYEAMIEAMDTEIGRLLLAIGPELADTTVIFMGDNGTPGHLLQPPYEQGRGKMTLYQGGVQVPLIVAGRGVTAKGLESHALVHASDLYATIAELATVDLAKTHPDPSSLDSFSFVPFLSDPTLPTVRTSIASEYFFVNGPGEGAPAQLPNLGPQVCQNDLGFSGPGAVTLSVCGTHLTPGNEVDVEITGAPPLASGVLLNSWVLDPQPFGGGTVAPGQAFEIIDFTTDAFGAATIPNLKTIGEEISVYMQAVVDDAGAPGGVVISNAVEAQHLPWNIKGASDGRYKIVRWVNGGATELYDLSVDPLETIDLLANGGLSQDEQTALDALNAVIDGL